MSQNIQAKFTEARKALVSAVRVISKLKSENLRLRDALKEALEMAEMHVRGHAIYKTPHDGDCTKQAHTCLVCLATTHAAEMRAALYPDGENSEKQV
jgi:hypothetical protein